MIRIFFPTDFLFTQNLLSVTVCWKLKEKKQGKIFLSVIRDSPRKLTAVLEIRICFKFYFFQFLMLQHNCVMDQLTIQGKFYKRASIPLEIFFLLKKKGFWNCHGEFHSLTRGRVTHALLTPLSTPENSLSRDQNKHGEHMALLICFSGTISLNRGY